MRRHYEGEQLVVGVVIVVLKLGTNSREVTSFVYI
jgi:hypothetical protein